MMKKKKKDDAIDDAKANEDNEESVQAKSVKSKE